MERFVELSYEFYVKVDYFYLLVIGVNGDFE